MSKFPFFSLPEGISGDETPLDPDLLVKVISGMYLPAGSAGEADELISHADLVESIRGTLTDVKSAAVFDAMTNIGFTNKTIEGTIYWLVFNT